MKFPILASFIVFLLWFTFVLKHNSRKQEKMEEEFWDREAQANSTPRRSLDDLDYIHVPLETLPFEILPEDDDIAECHRIIRTFTDKKTVNLTGLSNTELKLQYGAPNINLLIQYDHNFMQLVRALQTWGELLLKKEYRKEAQIVWEYAVSIRTDISSTYRELSSLYADQKQFDQIRSLREVAQTLHSMMQKSILQDLDEKLSMENAVSGVSTTSVTSDSSSDTTIQD